ncbi:MAG TPA: DUF362 domain-containing protein [Candidatus Nanoarchaeia archaeon]|nr:DUF362 domain-containing protein [Candidatus Nanoarchaeia archaeon]
MITRWICENCSKKWIYPVEKCIYCKGDITKQHGSKLKVIGITNVMIPSPMHPIVPYNIILLQDEHGNRLPKKTMESYEIDDEYVEEEAETDDAVSIIKIKYDIYEAIKESLSLLKDVNLKDEKILIKPSIVTAAYPYQAVNVNPEFLDALLKYLLETGVSKENILVAEQALIGSDATSAAVKAGAISVCKKYGVAVQDISKGPFEEIEQDGYKFNVFREALNRRIINVPILKTNFQLGISGALENLARLVDEKTQRNMYYDNIDGTLPKLLKALNKNVKEKGIPMLHIADGSFGLQGQGPLALGEPAFLNIVYSSKNPQALDLAFCEASMLLIPEHVLNSGEKTSAHDIEVVGNSIDVLKYQINSSNPHETPHPDIKVIDGKACPACLNAMNSLTSKLVGLRGDELYVVIGSVLDESKLKGRDRIVALGDCAIKKMGEMKLGYTAKISERDDPVEQVVLLKKLLTTKGTPKITPVDKVKSKMSKLLSKVTK